MHTCKCSAIALALLGIGFSATAAEVNMYGTYSVGAVYQDFRHQNGTNFTMSNGATSLDQSLYGLQGKEDLGNGLYAGFQLEGGFNPDDGTLMASNTIFDRKARLFLGNERFELTFGRFGNFVQAGTPYTIYGKLRANMTMTAMPGFAPASITFNPTFLSNVIAVRTNAKTGFFAQALYSNGSSNDEQNLDWSDRGKVAQVSTGWVGQQLRLGTVISYETQRHEPGKTPKHDDTLGVHLIASYDFGGPAISAVYYHGKNDWRVGAAPDLNKFVPKDTSEQSEKGLKSDALFFSAAYPMGQHHWSASLGALKVTWEGDMTNMKHDNGNVYMGGVVYRYKLSKRTTLYGAASYTRGSDLLADLPRLNQTFTTVGISHNF